MGSRWHLWLWTVRYLTPAQVSARAGRIVRRRWRAVRRARASGREDRRLRLLIPLYVGLGDCAADGPWRSDVEAAVERAREIARGRFTFLGRPVEAGAEPRWDDPHVSQLWRYHLHYFDYVTDLLVASGADDPSGAYRAFRDLVESWLQHNALKVGDGWHPYTISLRVPNWLHAAVAFEAQLKLDEAFRQRLLGSVYEQARFIAAELEVDVRGNHLLKNLRALALAGLAFEGAEPQAWLGRALGMLERELAEQVLPDGGHFERAPGYHTVVLQDVLEIGLALKRNGRTPPVWLDDALRAMLEYLVAILPPSGHVPLLKDTAWDAARTPDDLLAAGALYLADPRFKHSKAFGLYPLLVFGLPGWHRFRGWPLERGPVASSALAATGHHVMRDDRRGDFLILDVGRPCPDYLPAHAHADLLSYELSVDGERIVVDSGVYEYAAGAWRDYFRSTRAHNTVEVDGQDQSEVWASFRVARRARPRAVLWRPERDGIVAQGEHDGYARLAVPLHHRRTVAWAKAGFWLFVDELRGTGRTRAASHVHFHPRIEPEPAGDGAWRLVGGRAPLWLTPFGHEAHALCRGRMDAPRQGWYSERFGELAANTVLTLRPATTLPVLCGYVIARDAPASVSVTSTDEGHRLSIIALGAEHVLDLPRQGPPRLA